MSGLLTGLFGEQQEPQQPINGGLLGFGPNALMGFGMGMLGSDGTNAWRNAMQGYFAGSGVDVKQGDYRQQQAEKQRQQQAVQQWLASQPNLDAGTRAMIASNPTIAAELVQKKMAQQYGVGAQAQFGLNPIYGTDESGAPAVAQLNNQGQMVRTQMPQGFQLARDPIKLDAGTEWILLDPQTRAVVGRQSKNVAQEAAQQQLGKMQGEAVANMPGGLARADNALQTIDQLRNHPGKKYAIGALGVVPGIPGTPQRGFVALLDQAKGQAFLQAYEMLKGGGQITEVEGKKAEAAIVRLDRAQTQEDFDKALNDLEAAIRRGMELLQQKAGQPGAAPSAAPANNDPLGIR